jgi:RNase adapter protein RapZ
MCVSASAEVEIMSREVVVISGMSGAGKSCAARAFEDMGFFVVDNLPPQLIETLIRLSETSGGELAKFALVCDARDLNFLSAFEPTWTQLKKSDHNIRLLFLDCSEDILLQRFKETRRRHPLDHGAGLQDAISRERHLLEYIHSNADDIIDTQELTVHDLKKKVWDYFGSRQNASMRVTVMSFGFKYGLPRNLDLCLDVRFLANPFFVPELRPLSGKDIAVADYVRSSKEAKLFEDHVSGLLQFLLPQYQQEGKSYLTIAFGCTGGRHRSVALTESLSSKLTENGYEVSIEHRDLKKFPG